MESLKNKNKTKINNYYNIGLIDGNFAVVESKYKIDDLDELLNEGDEISNKDNKKIIKYDNKEVEINFPWDIELKPKFFFITETSSIYHKKILPYINKIYKENTKWIYKILYENAEKEKIVVRNDKFIIIKDIMFKCNNIKSFYLLGIPINKLKTIRDLRKKHISLLNNIKQSMLDYALNFGLVEDNLYFFFHYHPSFYHLHLHCCIINHKNLSLKYYRIHMLDEVIQNLSKSSYYYRNIDIKFEIPETHQIYKLINSK